MTKQEKLAVINGLTEQLNAYPHFYLADIEALNAEQTAALRRQCFEKKVKLVVVKNTLLTKALENVGKADADLLAVLKGSHLLCSPRQVRFLHSSSRSSARRAISLF